MNHAKDIRISQLLAATHSDNFVAETIICLPLILFFLHHSLSLHGNSSQLLYKEKNIDATKIP